MVLKCIKKQKLTKQFQGYKGVYLTTFDCIDINLRLVGGLLWVLINYESY